MAKKESTDRELINKYSSMYLPKHAPKNKNLNFREEITEEIYEQLKKDKHYKEWIEELRQHDKRVTLRSKIEEQVMNVALLRASSANNWEDIQRGEKALEKLWEEFYALGEEE